MQKKQKKIYFAKHSAMNSKMQDNKRNCTGRIIFCRPHFVSSNL